MRSSPGLGRISEALRKFSEAVESALDLVYPPACGACGSEILPGRNPVDAVLCPDCAASVEPIQGDLCPVCATPAWSGAARVQREDGGHPECGDCRRLTPSFRRVHVKWLYGGPLLEAVHALKYDRKVHLARPLGRLLAAGVARDTRSDVVVPVPSHPRRVRERGFDHASCLASEVGAGFGLPVLHDALKRRRHTPPQARLPLGSRLSNLEGAVLAGKRAGKRLEGRSVLLVDDVMTSGATASFCAAALLGAGAAVVDVAVLARA